MRVHVCLRLVHITTVSEHVLVRRTSTQAVTSNESEESFGCRTFAKHQTTSPQPDDDNYALAFLA